MNRIRIEAIHASQLLLPRVLSARHHQPIPSFLSRARMNSPQSWRKSCWLHSLLRFPKRRHITKTQPRMIDCDDRDSDPTRMCQSWGNHHHPRGTAPAGPFLLGHSWLWSAPRTRRPLLWCGSLCQRRSKNRPCGGVKVYRLSWVRSLSP